MKHASTEPSTRLARRLRIGDAVVLGLGSMIGSGVFAAISPAAAAAGSGLLIGLVIAGVVAYCNANSTARLAVEYPVSGGVYVYGRERLGPFWGYLAGWGFVVGKTASCAAMALTVGAYASPTWQRPIAISAVVALAAVNHVGVSKTVVALPAPAFQESGCGLLHRVPRHVQAQEVPISDTLSVRPLAQHGVRGVPGVDVGQLTDLAVEERAALALLRGGQTGPPGVVVRDQLAAPFEDVEQK